MLLYLWYSYQYFKNVMSKCVYMCFYDTYFLIIDNFVLFFLRYFVAVTESSESTQIGKNVYSKILIAVKKSDREHSKDKE